MIRSTKYWFIKYIDSVLSINFIVSTTVVKIVWLEIVKIILNIWWQPWHVIKMAFKFNRLLIRYAWFGNLAVCIRSWRPIEIRLGFICSSLLKVAFMICLYFRLTRDTCNVITVSGHLCARRGEMATGSFIICVPVLCRSGPRRARKTAIRNEWCMCSSAMSSATYTPEYYHGNHQTTKVSTTV